MVWYAPIASRQPSLFCLCRWLSLRPRVVLLKEAHIKSTEGIERGGGGDDDHHEPSERDEQQ